MLQLLRFLQAQTGQSSVNLGLVGLTFACLVWALTLFMGVNLEPGAQTLYQTTEPLRQGLQTVYDITAPAREHVQGIIEGWLQ